MKPPMTKRQILEWIAGQDTLDTRSTMGDNPKSASACRYNGPDGRHCAFALMCNEPEKLVEYRGASGQLLSFGEGILKPEFRGHPIPFYTRCQSLHDDVFCWTKEGISDYGKQFIEEVLKEDWAQD